MSKTLMVLFALLMAPAAAQTEPASPAMAGSDAAKLDGAARPDAGEVERFGPAVDAPLVCRLSPQDSGRLAVEPCRPAPPSPAVRARRRAVPRIIDRMPVTPAPAPVYGYRPPPSPPAVASSSASPSAPPVPIAGCDAGGCRDAAGVPHSGGVGNATIDPNGKLCNREGGWLRCF